jgi:hypothetical protein
MLNVDFNDKMFVIYDIDKEETYTEIPNDFLGLKLTDGTKDPTKTEIRELASRIELKSNSEGVLLHVLNSDNLDSYI